MQTTRLNSHLRLAGVALAACLALAACDTGDGKTLRDPTGTLPPPTSTTTTTLVRDGVGSLAAPVDDAGQIPLPTSVNELPGEFRLFTPWLDGAAIDARHSCDDENISPAVSWIGVPAGTVELAVVMVDESVTSGTPFVHWVIAGLNPTEVALTEGDVPLGAIQALNFFGDVGYGGPCPPPGEAPHVYRITVHALNQQVELADGTPATDLLGFIETVSVASADVTGTFLR